MTLVWAGSFAKDFLSTLIDDSLGYICCKSGKNHSTVVERCMQTDTFF